MKLHGALASPYVSRVVLYSRLKGINLVPVMPEGGIKTPTYLAMNPMGKMPVLEVDGAVIPESEVICEYLDEKYPGKGSVPTDALSRANGRLISRILDLYAMPHGMVLFHNMNPAQRDAAAVDAAKNGLSEAFGFIEHFMTVNPYAAASKPTVADCALVPMFEILRRTVFPALDFPDPCKGSGKFAAWWKSVSRDPVVEPFITESGPAVDAFLKMLAGG